MNKKIIEKAGRDVIVAALKSRNYSEIERINQAAASDALEVFNLVASGSASVAWYDMPAVKTQSGAVSVMRHVLHQLPKRGGFLQLSCIEIKNGQDIPTSDLQFSISDGFGGFFRELPAKTTFFYRIVKSSALSGLVCVFAFVLSRLSRSAAGPRPAKRLLWHNCHKMNLDNRKMIDFRALTGVLCP